MDADRAPSPSAPAAGTVPWLGVGVAGAVVIAVLGGAAFAVVQARNDSADLRAEMAELVRRQREQAAAANSATAQASELQRLRSLDQEIAGMRLAVQELNDKAAAREAELNKVITFLRSEVDAKQAAIDRLEGRTLPRVTPAGTEPPPVDLPLESDEAATPAPGTPPATPPTPADPPRRPRRTR